MKLSLNMYLIYIIMLACIIMLAYEDLVSTAIYGLFAGISIAYYIMTGNKARNDLRRVNQASGMHQEHDISI